MPEKSYSLSELTAFINKVMKVNFDSPMWIRAEISEFRENANGHCYLEFIEKNKNSDNLVAKIKGMIWANVYRMLKPYFEENTGQKLRAGLNVLVAVTVDFHEVYGLSLNVKDIDPAFTLGEMALRRQEVIRQLEADGISEMNKSQTIPFLPQRIAVISSLTAAGYDDFCNQLKNNPEKFIFYTRLFPAIMQGEQAESSVISALESVYNYAEKFDVVVIIRGGGATTDLSCFDSYELASNCAQFPLPLITGIGHQRDLSVADMVANTSVKTPTAAAEFLIERLHLAKDAAYTIFEHIFELLKNRSQKESTRLNDLNWKIKHALRQKTTSGTILLEKQKSRLQSSIKLALAYQQNKLALAEKSIERHSPAFLLKYGYTITTLNGKKLTSASDVKKGDKLRTYLADGQIASTIDSIDQK